MITGELFIHEIDGRIQFDLNCRGDGETEEEVRMAQLIRLAINQAIIADAKVNAEQLTTVTRGVPIPEA